MPPENPPNQPETPNEGGRWYHIWKNRVISQFKQWRPLKWLDRQLLRKTGTPLTMQQPREEETLTNIQTVSAHLQNRNLIDILERRITEVTSVESRWDATDDVIGGKNTDGIEDKYSKASFHIDHSLAEWEYSLYESGPAVPPEQKDADNYPHKGGRWANVSWKSMEIAGHTIIYPIPRKLKVRYQIAGLSREWITEISPFGYRNSGTYTAEYSRIITKICDKVRERELNRVRTTPGIAAAKREEIERNINQKVDLIKNMYTQLVTDIISDYCGFGEGSSGGQLAQDIHFESKYREYLKKNAAPPASSIETLYITLHRGVQDLMTPNEIEHYSTWKVVGPLVYGKRAENAVVKADLRGALTPRADEVDVGLDKFGYPLMVDYDNTVLLDQFARRANPLTAPPARAVPPDFVQNLDFLEAAHYTANWHDAIRDDTRDGRFHTGGSLTVMDYVEANNPSVWKLWEMREEENIREQREVDVTLTRNVAGVGTKGTDIKYKVVPTDKNPAFDFKAAPRKGVWKHGGRKYYYGMPDDVDDSDEPHITSRGVSMYIVEKITRDLTKWPDIQNLLNTIGRKTKGIDYGPRPWDMWGGKKKPAFVTNIFDWRGDMLNRLNQPVYSPEQSLSEKGYRDMYAREH